MTEPIRHNKIDVSQIIVRKVKTNGDTVGSMFSNSGTITNLNISNATIATLNSTQSTIGTLLVGTRVDAPAATIANVVSTTQSTGTLIVPNGTIGNLFSTNSTMTNLVATTGMNMGDSKFYSYTGSVVNNTNGTLILNINNTNSHYYIKVIATLQETSVATNTSTLQFESTGAAGVGNTSLSIWNTSVNNPANSYPWSTTVTTNVVGPTYQFAPNVSLRNYTYTLFVHLVGTAKISTLSQDSATVKTWSH